MTTSRMLGVLSIFVTCVVAAAASSVVKRDTHSLVIPLTYEPASLLLTAAVEIGTPGSSYNLIVDTGSPFIIIQKSTFHATPSTWDPSDGVQPDMSSIGGYITTTPIPQEGGSKPPAKLQMHFLTDSAVLVEASGVRAGEGAKKGNLTVGLTQLEDLKKAQGILGLSPPFSSVKNSPPPPTTGSGKNKRDSKPGPAAQLPSLDVSFLHSYLSPEHKTKLGMTGSSHFYVSFSVPVAHAPPSGELVFPLAGSKLPPSIPGYDYARSISITPETGSTFPRRPFWGIAHRPDLGFTLNGKPLADIRIDGLLLDSGTSGIVGPPSEVSKIFAAIGEGDAGVTRWHVKGSSAVLGKTACTSPLQMGFAIGDQQVAFTAVRQPVAIVEGMRRTRHIDGHTSGQLARGGLLSPLRSYVDMGIQHVVNFWDGVASFWYQPKQGGGKGGGFLGLGLGGGNGNRRRKRHLHRRTLEVGLTIGDGVGTNPDPDPDPAPNPSGDQDRDQDQGGGQGDDAGKDDQGAGAQDAEKQCDITLMGSPEVEKMFPPNANGEPLKVWILGTEFFQQNLVYHNIDTAETVILPRTQQPQPPAKP